MASFLHSGPASSALRKQVVALRVSPAQSMASVPACSSFSTLCPQARLQASLRPQSSLPTLSIRQSRTFLTQLRRQAQALKEHSTSASASPTPAKSAKNPSPPLQLTNLPYFVRRTASNQLPVYVDTKAGGNKQLTKVQKTEGDLDALRNDLAIALGVTDVRGKPNPDVTLNRLTGHIIIKVCLKSHDIIMLHRNINSHYAGLAET
ncbi:unnamed protein product [Penicillium salamii]|uniref:Large ribosomal subunit protein mL49 n=1 Tax=Penicillium salamii TaxID=1612424 RepID=A0A9W4N573_9EURO|nr:unnamed protein product [Penicillium salamii]CAG8239007.1 unnamed protein product [Penicillium salamii]CAG8288922.1 unnamed protein product [Penicillium salamii]CAG8290825.1 unnamed protein product [Penicillium salamii]CAG8399448.1 unnamed protein product [Penicillium salamii]